MPAFELRYQVLESHTRLGSHIPAFLTPEHHIVSSLQLVVPSLGVQGVDPVVPAVVLQGHLPAAGQLGGGPDSLQPVRGILSSRPLDVDAAGEGFYETRREVTSAEFLEDVTPL